MKKIILLFFGTVALLRAEPLTPGRVEALRSQIRANFFVPEPLPALAAETHRRFSPRREWRRKR